VKRFSDKKCGKNKELERSTEPSEVKIELPLSEGQLSVPKLIEGVGRMEQIQSYKAKGITKAFSGVDVLHGVDLTIKAGVLHGLLGHNGAGKSTLLKIMAGAFQPDGGTLSLGSEKVQFASPREALAQGIGCVYQELRLIPNLTVAENLFLGRERKKAGFKQIAEMNAYSAKLLETHGLLMDVTRPVKELSHPEKQLVEVIANLEGDVRFLFLDEPTTALDGQQAAELLKNIRTIARERQVGMVLVSHKLDEVLGVCDEVTVLSSGRVVYYAQGESMSHKAVVDAIVGGSHSKHEQGKTEMPNDNRPTHDDIFMVVKNLGGKRLKSVNLTVKKGEILGLYGLVGSGRTRFLRSLYGVEAITRGSVILDGKAYQPKSPKEAIANAIAFLTEERKVDGFIPLMSALQNVALSTLPRYRHRGLVRLGAMQAATRRSLIAIATHGRLDGAVTSLSGGNQQKVLLARIIEQDAQLILLDEPTKGVDIGAKADIYDIIRNLGREGRSIIVASSEEEELMEICDRIAIFRHGYCDGSALPVADWSAARLREAAWG